MTATTIVNDKAEGLLILSVFSARLRLFHGANIGHGIPGPV